MTYSSLTECSHDKVLPSLLVVPTVARVLQKGALDTNYLI